MHCRQLVKSKSCNAQNAIVASPILFAVRHNLPHPRLPGSQHTATETLAGEDESTHELGQTLTADSRLA